MPEVSGKSKADNIELGTEQKFKKLLSSIDKKPKVRLTFMFLYCIGMCIGELLALTMKILIRKSEL